MTHTPNRQVAAVSPPVPDGAPLFYSVAQAAQMLGMSAMTLYRAINSGGFPAVRIRGRLIVPARAIEAIVEMAITEQTIVDAGDWVPVPRRSAE